MWVMKTARPLQSSPGMRASAAMPLMPTKPPAREEPKVHGYKPPPDQEAWFREKTEAGWRTSDVLAEVVGTYMALEKGLGDLEAEIESFARAEGLLKPSTPPGDWSWRREAVLRWMKLGHDSWRKSSKGK